MTLLIADPTLQEDLIARRKAIGADHYDEVWEGVYFMPPSPNVDHGHRQSGLVRILLEIVEDQGLGGVITAPNVSDRRDDWTYNYRVPDIAVVLSDSRAENAVTHLVGPVDFLVEVVSPGDRTYEKLDFYAQVGVRELLILDRDPWALKLYRNDGQELALVAELLPGDGKSAESEILPLRLEFIQGDAAPVVAAISADKRWTA